MKLLHGINSAEKLRTDYSDQPYTIVYPLQNSILVRSPQIKNEHKLEKGENYIFSCFSFNHSTKLSRITGHA